ncbi:hypothetical protein JW721_00760 [Candidatus Micrarchaeota archaeon]|nr:hypothetical protein [Candidatus Micrarchaeota archaeon]
MNVQTLHKLLKKGVTTINDVPATAKELSALTGISISNAARIVREAEAARGENGEGAKNGNGGGPMESGKKENGKKNGGRGANKNWRKGAPTSLK